MRFKKAYIEITNICNLNCSFCPGTKRTPGKMTAEQFSVIAEKIRPYTDFVYLHLMGEPLLHSELEQILHSAQLQNLRVIVTTNGTLLQEKGDILLQSAAVHKVNISLQSFEANAKRNMEEYMDGVCSFSQKAKERGIITVFRLWNKNGLDSLNEDLVRILKKWYPEEWKRSGRGIGLTEKVWLENGEKFEWPDLSAGNYGENCFCYGLRDQVGILRDGTVVPCCLDHDGDIPLGNLLRQTAEEIFCSERAQAIYNGFSERKAVEELCRRCGYARRFSK